MPERPFLHGMASAFDMFGVLNARQERATAGIAGYSEEFDAAGP